VLRAYQGGYAVRNLTGVLHHPHQVSTLLLNLERLQENSKSFYSCRTRILCEKNRFRHNYIQNSQRGFIRRRCYYSNVMFKTKKSKATVESNENDVEIEDNRKGYV
jgi:hypothetical protein